MRPDRPGPVQPDTARAAAMFARAAVRAPRALIWGRRSLARRVLHEFIWGDGVTPPAVDQCPEHHVWRVSCEPPCYGCGDCRCCGGRHG
jgi:hypothetical protein